MDQRYQWDDDKAESNLQKHKVGFEEAKTVFDDEFLITIYDTLHSDEEDRYISIGMSNQGRLLVVVHTDREDKIRIISGRVATSAERRNYAK